MAILPWKRMFISPTDRPCHCSHGASTGEHEAVELSDGDKSRYLGKGTLKAVKNSTAKSPRLCATGWMRPSAGSMRKMIELDGTPNKGRLGANAILAVSMAAARAVSAAAWISRSIAISAAPARTPCRCR